MTTENGTAQEETRVEEPPTVVRRLESADAATLVGLVETFEDLQMVLRCCERLMVELGAPGQSGVAPVRLAPVDAVVVEAVWTLALLSYARCFSTGQGGTALTEEDLTTAQPPTNATPPSQTGGDVLDWHKVMLRLRDHHADPDVNPRERFSVGVAQAADGSPGGVAITSAKQPLVDVVAVRQTGAVAYALSALVNERIETQQSVVFAAVQGTTAAELDKLDRLDVSTG